MKAYCKIKRAETGINNKKLCKNQNFKTKRPHLDFDECTNIEPWTSE